jgi:pimeloyl-ACP methyl ester carboxylesterase
MSAARWILLHGTPLTPAVWEPVADALRADGIDVACPSLEERGDSRAHATRIAATLGDAGEVVVVGHSFGGQVAIDLALSLAAEGRLAGLGAVCTRATPFPPFGAAAAGLRDGRMPDPAAAIARWFTDAERAAGSPLIAYAEQCLRTADPLVWADALDSIATYDRSARLAGIAAPAVVVAAEHDAVSPPDVMRELAAGIPGAALHVLEGTSHMGPFLRPETLTGLLRGMLAAT